MDAEENAPAGLTPANGSYCLGLPFGSLRQQSPSRKDPTHLERPVPLPVGTHDLTKTPSSEVISQVFAHAQLPVRENVRTSLMPYMTMTRFRRKWLRCGSCAIAGPRPGPARGPQTPNARVWWPRARRLALLSLRWASWWQKVGILIGPQAGLDQ